MKNYWENPADFEIDTGKNILRYWKKAGRFQVCMPHWTDKDGSVAECFRALQHV